MTTSPTVLRLASRLEQVGFSDIVKLRNRVMELRKQGATVYQFEGGEPFMPTPDSIKEAMKHALDENQTRYAPSSGIPELREAIAEKLRTRNRIPARAEDVIVVNGGMQALFGAFQSIVNPGDEVLLFSPYWTPIKDLVSHCQGRSVLVPTDEARSSLVRMNRRWWNAMLTQAISVQIRLGVSRCRNKHRPTLRFRGSSSS